MNEKLIPKDKIFQMLLEINNQLEVLEETLGIKVDKEADTEWVEQKQLLDKAQKILVCTEQALFRRNVIGHSNELLTAQLTLKPNLSHA